MNLNTGLAQGNVAVGLVQGARDGVNAYGCEFVFSHLNKGQLAAVSVTS